MPRLSSADTLLTQGVCDLNLQLMRRALEAGANADLRVSSQTLPATLSHEDDNRDDEDRWVGARSKTLFELALGRPGDFGPDDKKDRLRVAAFRLLDEYSSGLADGAASHILYEACLRRCSPAVIQWLVDAGADVRIHHGRWATTPLHVNERADVVPVLVAAGASVACRTTWRKTPLAFAAGQIGEAHSTGLFTALVAAGTDVNAGDLDGRTALHTVAERESAAEGPMCQAFLEELLALGADPTIPNLRGQTPVAERLQFVSDGTFPWRDDENEGLWYRALRVTLFLAAATAWHRRRHMLLAARGRATS